MVVRDAPQDSFDDGLFDAVDLEHVQLSSAPAPDANAGANSRFRAYPPNQVMLVPPSVDEWLPENHPLGQVALDGTKVRANASRRKTMSYARLSEKQTVLAKEVSDLLAEAEQIYAGEDARFGDQRGDELPAELARREGRLVKIAAATAVVKPTAQRNFTDPDARIMKTADGSFHYSYTAQAIVDGDHQVLVATKLSNIAVDVQQIVPMLGLLEETVRTSPREVLIDAGYCSTGRMKHSDAVPETVTGAPPEGASLREQIAHRLKTDAGEAAYARRKAIVEPVFGQIHTRQGKHLLLRELEQAKAEWLLIAGCHNLMKLFSHRTKIAATAG